MEGKNNKLRKLQKEVKGITLIALVVTIIVLLILAGVAINLTIGQNGIFKRAELASNKWNEASKNEQNEMDKAANFIDDYINGKGGGDKVTWLEDVPIPDGFYYVGGSKDTGLVISDSDLDKKEYTDENKNADVSTDLNGNQFVWVPVPEPSKLFTDETVQLDAVKTTTEVYSKLTIRDGDSYTAGAPGETKKVREPDVLSDHDTKSKFADIILGTSGTGNAEELAKVFVKDYKAMSDSIKKYKGFYIGRYEITGTVDSPKEQKGKVLRADSSQAKNWYGLYKACQNVIKNNEEVTSTMIYGCQWDATMEWLKQTTFKGAEEKVDSDSSSWGNYNQSGNLVGTPEYTGINPTYEVNKIFNLAGNFGEWTQEAESDDSRVLRGGNYDISGSKGPASDRTYGYTGNSSSTYSSRPALYINP